MDNDLISRKMAIDAIIDHIREKFAQRDTPLNYISGLYKAEDIIEILPSEQPDIIACRDCKHWTNNISDSNLRDYYCNEAAHGFHYRCSGYDYCSFAERKE